MEPESSSVCGRMTERRLLNRGGPPSEPGARTGGQGKSGNVGWARMCCASVAMVTMRVAA